MNKTEVEVYRGIVPVELVVVAVVVVVVAMIAKQYVKNAGTLEQYWSGTLECWNTGFPFEFEEVCQ